MKDKNLKIYIKDIKEDKEILKKLLESNEELKNCVWKQCYEDNMYLQQEEGNYMFGENWNKYIDLKDNYDSFYLRLNNYNEFYKNLDSDYLCSDGLKIYKKIKKLIEKKDNFIAYDKYDEEKLEELEEEIEKLCKELLEICEKQLHEYEKIDDSLVLEYFIFNVQENFMFEDLYYYNIENDYILYEDISYTRNWN